MFRMKRRDFIKTIASASAAIGLPTIIPASALGKGGAVAPSERVTMGSIGLGTQGTANTQNFFGDKRVQIVGLCDVNNTEGPQYYGYGNNETKGLRNARKLFGMDIPTYDDFRELLARKDVDVVMTALPDHWHAIVGIACVNAGKDVFGEKPLTRTIREGKVLRDTVLNSGRIWQTGSWQRSLPDFVRAAEIVRNGYLGRISRIKIGLPSNFKAEVLPPVPVPKGMNWEMWQGPAQPSYFNPRKTFTRWRGVTNYSAGKIADWGAHHLDIAHWALGFDDTGASEIVPELVHQLSARERALRVGQKLEQKVKFAHGKGQLLAVDICRVLVLVHPQIASNKLSALLDIGASKESAHPQDQDIRIEGLYDVIVDACVETALFGKFIVKGGHEEYGNMAVGSAYPLRQRKTVHFRHHYVAYQHIEGLLLRSP